MQSSSDLQKMVQMTSVIHKELWETRICPLEGSKQLFDSYDICQVMQQKAQKSLKIIKWINIVTAGVIVAFGLAGTVYTAITSLIAAKFFMIFSPIYMILFGVVLFATEFKVDFVLQKVGFLRSLLGRAVFNIFLASQVFYFFSCGTANELLGWVFGVILFALGGFYTFLHFCKGNQYSDAMKSRLQL